jgi:hypothetical protein
MPKSSLSSALFGRWLLTRFGPPWDGSWIFRPSPRNRRVRIGRQ